jgi:beta-lactamase class A
VNFSEEIDGLIKNYSGTAAICVKNIKTGKNFFYNEDIIFPSASIIKLVVMGEILRKVDIGEITLDKKVIVTDSLITRGDGILKHLDAVHSFSIRELITLMVIVSDNTAANILIDMAKKEDINKFSKNLGLKNTVLNRKMMDFKAAREGKENITCTADICTFLELLYNGKIINEDCSDFMIDIMKRQQVHGRIDMFLPENIVLAHKTGTLENLEHDAGILYGNKSDYVVCIFTRNGKSNAECRRFIGCVAKAFYYE